MTKAPTIKDMLHKAQRNLNREKARLKECICAEEALNTLLRLIPDEPTFGRMVTGLSPLVQMLAERAANAMRLRAQRNAAAVARVFELGLAGLGAAVARPAEERRTFLDKLLASVATNLEHQPGTLTSRASRGRSPAGPAGRLDAVGKAARAPLRCETLCACEPARSPLDILWLRFGVHEGVGS